MRVNRSSDYACRALVYLARNGGGPLDTPSIAREIGVSPTYLRKIMQSLSRAGFVRTVAGAAGGVILSVALSGKSLKDVLEAVDGPIVLSECIPHPESCGNAPACKIRGGLTAVQDRVRHEFSSRRIADFV